jgi:hypothetical protein
LSTKITKSRSDFVVNNSQPEGIPQSNKPLKSGAEIVENIIENNK